MTLAGAGAEAAATGAAALLGGGAALVAGGGEPHAEKVSAPSANEAKSNTAEFADGRSMADKIERTAAVVTCLR